MISKFLKAAGVRTQKQFLQKYPTEASFFRDYPEMMQYAYGGTYEDGGQPTPEEMAMMQQQQAAQEQGMQQQGAAGGQGDQEQMMQQILQFIVQSLQQGIAPEEILKKLVEQGIPQQQATQIIQAVMQKIQEQQQGGGGGQEQQPAMEMGGTPEEEGYQNQPVMARGGMFPYSNYGGTRLPAAPIVGPNDGYTGTSSAGVYYNNGGSFSNPGFNALPLEIQSKIKRASGKAAYGGGIYKKGGEYDLTQKEIQDLINKGYKIQYI